MDETTHYKPDGYTSLSPYLIVADAEAAIAFIRRTFGSEPLFVHRDGSGRIAHAELRIDDSIVMLGQAPDGPDCNVHLYVADVDDCFARAVEAGGSVVQDVEEKGDGDRRGGVRDPAGTTWWLSTMIARDRPPVAA